MSDEQNNQDNQVNDILRELTDQINQGSHAPAPAPEQPSVPAPVAEPEAPAPVAEPAPAVEPAPEVPVATPPAPKPKNADKKKRKKVIYNIAIIICAIVFAVSAFFLVRWLVENFRSSNEQTELEDVADVKEELVVDNGVSVIPPLGYGELYSVNLTELQRRNPNTVAWIRVTGTNVNYPVLQTDNNEYYLKRDFYHSYTTAGWVFGDYRCNFASVTANRNLIVYGHARQDMSKFGSLTYCRRSWWLNNPDYHYIHITTPYEETLWKVFAVYTTSTDFYYIQTDFPTDAEFTKLTNEMLRRSIYDFGTEVTPTDTILTLSTCALDADRLVVNAVLVESRPVIRAAE